MTDNAKPPSTFRKIIAGILDFFTIFFVGGSVIGQLTGGGTEGGFSLSGGPAIALFAVIGVYFYAGRKYAGGTLWQRILRA